MSDNDIAIVGLAAHLPGARDPYQFWANLRAGFESVRELTEEQLLDAGVSKEMMRRPGYVKSASVLEDVFHFDADFFGLSPKEAGIMDPQHRHFLMAVWEAMEDAGHVPEAFDGAIGLFAGCGANSYYMFNLLTNPDLVRDVGLFLLRHTGNDKDFLATRASYLFNLRGPSVNVQTACSTSLVATHLAVQHLLSGECDMALAGGVTIEIPHGQGYQYHEGEVLSPDGHCRAFDHRSQGTVFGSGVGIVAMRRLQDALDDGDQIYAVVKGTAVNNDGTQKVGYLAPSVDGQAACITEALGVAEIEPQSLSYVECHGTGTPMGDPIEIAALGQAFRADADKTGYCRIGSVKTNIGHLDTAAGVASLIKVSLALRNGEIPPSLNFERNNPQLDIEQSPFVVNAELTDWRREGSSPRRAGVNSLGVGGTNAFAVVEEAPERTASPSSNAWRLLTLSAKNRAALDSSSSRLAAHLLAHPKLDLADVSWTLQVGRHHFPERRVLAARDRDEAIALLEARDTRRVFSHSAPTGERSIAFMFPGGGTQYARMAADLHGAHPEFAASLAEGLELLRTAYDLDLRPLLLCDPDEVEGAGALLQTPANQLPAIFIVEHALARLLISWGIEPDALVGHSVGENTAACVAGTMSFADCLGLVVLRGRLTELVVGSTSAVPVAPQDITEIIEELGLDLAVVNAPDLSVVSGGDEAIAAFEGRVRADGIEPQRVKVRAAAHSRLLDPVLAEFRAYLESITLSAPTIPWVSNRTGTWITDEQATDPGYWVEHLRHTVFFSDCITTLAADPTRVLLEVGPGKALSSLARMNPEFKSTQAAIPTMRHPDENLDDEAFLLTAIGRLWATGAPLDVDRLFADGDRRRVGLPTYAFQTQPFFIEPGAGRSPGETPSGSYVDREPDESRWFWEPVWKSHDCGEPISDTVTWLVLLDQAGVGSEVAARLRQRGDDVVMVRIGDSFHHVSDGEYVIAPENGLMDYENLMRDLVRTGHVPDRIAHLALLATDDRQYRPGSSFFHRNQELGFQSLVLLAQAWASAGLARPLHVAVATMGSQSVVSTDVAPWPEQATVLGPVRIIPREFADVTLSTFDIDQLELFPDSRLKSGLEDVADVVTGIRRSGLTAHLRHRTNGDERPGRARRGRRQTLVDAVTAELLAPPVHQIVALRGERRFVHEVRRVSLDIEPAPPRLRRGGAVLITGGLGGIGLTIAEQLFESSGAQLALLSRTAMPDRAAWDDLASRLGPDHPTSDRITRIRALEAGGAEILLLAGDVTDVERMREVTATVRERFGGIHGVVHAAGVVDDNLLVTKSLADMDDVLAPKVYGTLVLEQAVEHDDLDLFVMFSSTSTVTAPLGQVDYVAANAFLNAFAAARRAQGSDHVLALNWGVWNEVGMAAEAAVRLDRSAAPEEVPCAHPFYDARTTDRRGVTRLTARWQTEDVWLLDDHRNVAGEALVPGSGYAELAKAALEEIGVDKPFEIRDLTFLRPLASPSGGHVDVQAVLTPSEEGYLFEVREAVAVGASTAEDSPSPGRPGWRKAAEATLALYEQPPAPTIDLVAEQAACPVREAVRTHQQDHLRFGPRWDVVERVQRGDHAALAWLRLPDAFVGDLDAVALHPAMVDLGTGFAMSLVEGYTGEHLWVPVSYRSIRIFDRLPREAVALATAHAGSSEASGFATFDVALCDPAGRVIVQVEEFTIKRIDGLLDVGLGRPVLAADVEFEQPDGAERQLSQSELVFQHNLSQGIVPDEGKRAFARVLADGHRPVIYASSMDVTALQSQAQQASAAQTRPASTDSSAVFSRPELDSEYVAPRNDIEESLVAVWQELLGINEIGVQDSFFDLGGHSLIAVRLFAKVKRLFSVDFPISVLFEAPTVEACAALIAGAMPARGSAEAGDDAAGSDSTVAVSRPRYTHLVAMHAGEGGQKTPYFLVAGMFGNVLNLRHLAHQVGSDRPFYGVQARGLYGGEAPHEDFGDMARDYLAEIRTVQPHGPYLLGGFSGGGIAAFEMAHQLNDAGEKVGLLVFLDTALAFNPELTVADRLKIQRDNISEKGVGYVKEWAVNRVRWEQEKRRRRLQGSDAPTEEGALHSTVIESAFYRAIDRYETRPWDGVITLYRPKLTPLHMLGPDRQINIHRRFIYDDNGWGPFCRRIDVIEVPGDHDAMVLEPNVRVLAAHLRQALQQADERIGASLQSSSR
ncbi:MAG: SDR family NAD(P)-dependent oxidoreductase [Actinomycetota bacterium]|nr:SDR family NAD(P)-dependent oxidoreductase [Actinomycetota bacterium]